MTRRRQYVVTASCRAPDDAVRVEGHGLIRYLMDQGIVQGCLECDGLHPGRSMDLEDVASTLDEIKHPPVSW